MRRKREREKDRLTQLNHPLQHLKLSRAAFYKNSSVRLVERQKLRLYLRDFREKTVFTHHLIQIG